MPPQPNKETEDLYKIALSFIPGVGNVLARTLLSYCGSAESVFTTPKGKLLKIPGIGDRIASAVLSSKLLHLAEAEVSKAQKAGAQILLYTDADFPQRLKHIPDSPVVLYAKGSGQVNTSRVLAIVGTRNATAYGRRFLEGFTEELKAVPDIMVVSGLAYGIDITAHRLCLQAGIPTYGVMANGIDSVYPAVHANTATDMLALGGLISENPVGSKPDAPKFPARNRIIAGMADAVLVVEAAEKGGALITADLANDYNREIFALPGDYREAYSKGCHKLVKENKAHLITGLKDLLNMMDWDSESKPSQKAFALPDSLAGDELKVCQMLMVKDLHIDELAMLIGLPVGRVASILLHLEFSGLVISRPGKKFGIKK